MANALSFARGFIARGWKVCSKFDGQPALFLLECDCQIAPTGLCRSTAASASR